MGQVTLRMRTDPVTGKRVIAIEYESDSSALPFEHEEEHRQLVDKVLEGGTMKARDKGKVLVDREQEGAPAETGPQAEPSAERASVKGGG